MIDYLSKVVKKDDRGFSFELLDLIVQKMGRATSFASHHNAKLPTFFYSKFWNKNSAGVDSFTFQLSDRFGLFVPQSVFNRKYDERK